MSLEQLLTKKQEQNIHNFSAGPCILADEVLYQAAQGAINYNNTGLSILEMSHRSPEYVEVMEEARNLVRELLNVPSSHEILFLQGGASLQFTMVPQNYLTESGKAGYINSGTWADGAIKESQIFGETQILASSEDKNFSYYPKSVEIPQDLDYFHFTSNNTIYGTQTLDTPETNVPLICDMSSDIFSREIDVCKYALIYAGAQKNLGPAGATLVIVKKDTLKETGRKTPKLLKYINHIKKDSMLNTPPCFSVFTAMLNLRWLKKEGGVSEMKRRSIKRSEMLYNEIDRNPLFEGTVINKEDRSRMNITFRLKDDNLNQSFLDLANKYKLSGIKGHRSVGGFRASMYNALRMESVQALVNCMQEFENTHR